MGLVQLEVEVLSAARASAVVVLVSRLGKTAQHLVKQAGAILSSSCGYFKALCVRASSKSFREMKLDSEVSLRTEFLHIFLDLRFPRPHPGSGLRTYGIRDSSPVPAISSLYVLFSQAHISCKMSKYCPHMARTQPGGWSHFIRPAKWGLVLIRS